MRRYNEKERAKILEGLERSGLSCWQYCRREGHCYLTVRGWLRKDVPVSGKKPGGIGLVEICTPEHEREDDCGMCTRVLLPGGIEVRFPAGTRVEELATFCREVKTC